MIKIKNISLDNFKSLNNFSMNLENFTCLIGLNGAGKSTILQGLDFISQLVKGDMSGWLVRRGLTSSNLISKIGSSKRSISVHVEFEIDDMHYLWTCIFNNLLLRCTNERIVQFDISETNKGNINSVNKVLLKLMYSKLKIYGENSFGEKDKMDDVFQSYEGSILSSLRDDKLTPILLELKNHIKNISSLDLLSPHVLRQKSRAKENELGLGGEHLAPFLDNFSKETREMLLENLKKCYPQIDELNIKKIRGGWKQIEISENFIDNKSLGIKIKNTSSEVNDGLLRLIAILAQLYTKKEFLLFDEIENGINPELIEFLVTILTQAKHQTIITTHSPMILNYISDDIAKKSILFVYKTRQGVTKVKPFFDIPRIEKKLDFMGAGEIYVDTKLSELSKELEEDEIRFYQEKVDKVNKKLDDINHEIDSLLKNGKLLSMDEFNTKVSDITSRSRLINQEANDLNKQLSFEIVKNEEMNKIYDDVESIKQQLKNINKAK